jgi:hypothetical protein
VGVGVAGGVSLTFGIFCPARAQRLAARASSDATGACSVSSNVAASRSKTAISLANQWLCFISGQADPSPSRALGREGREQREM